MNFTHEPFPQDDITADTGPTGRYYDTPGGRFPSVTTIIGRSKDDKSLVAWRKRVGDEEADRVVRQAGRRGTAVHDLAEKYLLNDPQWSRGAMPVNLASFHQIKKYLDKHVGIVKAIEMALWSSRLRTAGRTDLIAEWDGELAIIDFKTSRRTKDDEKCFGYFVQEACYGLMLYERLGVLPKKIITVMAVDHEQPIVFIKDRKDYDQYVRDIFVTRRENEHRT